ncbi:glycoside hydrolase family 19 protein [Pseudomonas umsongensis]|uniref:Glycoside hydrolase family 19 protein n=1 Tax=Pseudomonas umsongensis TaxID=198618 RepID=A0AAE7A285_9PSED|nr:glycoside hydrolase family 19 protein [Pseudomonas umsongensis]QJC82474.1 glycoside hydrolase family 19 protein [Pseudomonas umsongensis]
MPITQQQLLQILPNAGPVAGVFVSALNGAMARFNIQGRLRVAAFLAQIGHESGQLRTLVENLNYSADALIRTWPKRFNLVTATSVARKPEKIANIVYASRLGNGPAVTGDGWRYRGRGLIQITGWVNYQACGSALSLDLLAKPELLEQPAYAALSAAWFWSSNGLNELADAGQFEAITQRINGGLNGQADRLKLWGKATAVLALQAAVTNRTPTA